MSSPGVGPGPRPSQGRVRSATPRGRPEFTARPIPRPGVGPGLAASKAAVRPPHSRGGDCPRQESNLVCDLRRVACDPAHPEGSVGQQGRKDSNPVRPGWSRSPLPGGRPCRGHRPVGRAKVRPGVEPGPPPYHGGVPPITPADRRWTRWSSPSGSRTRLSGLRGRCPADRRTGQHRYRECVGQESNLQCPKAGGLQPPGRAHARPTHSRSLLTRARAGSNPQGPRVRGPPPCRFASRVLSTPAPPRGFEPLISSLTTRRALRAAPRGRFNHSAWPGGDSTLQAPAPEAGGHAGFGERDSNPHRPGQGRRAYH